MDRYREMTSIPLKVVPFLGSKSYLSTFTKNQLILNTFSSWVESHNLCSFNPVPLRHLPLWENPIVPPGIADSTLKAWASKGIKTLEDLYANDSLMSFELLSQTYNIPKHNFFKYLQVRHWVKEITPKTFPKIPTLSPFENVMFNKIVSSPRGIASVGYSTLSNNFKPFDNVVLKQRWEGDLDCTYDPVEWEYIMERMQTTLISTKHRQIQFNILHRTYYTPQKLHMLVRSQVNPANWNHKLGCI